LRRVWERVSSVIFSHRLKNTERSIHNGMVGGVLEVKAFCSNRGGGRGLF